MFALIAPVQSEGYGDASIFQAYEVFCCKIRDLKAPLFSQNPLVERVRKYPIYLAMMRAFSSGLEVIAACEADLSSVTAVGVSVLEGWKAYASEGERLALKSLFVPSLSPAEIGVYFAQRAQRASVGQALDVLAKARRLAAPRALAATKEAAEALGPAVFVDGPGFARVDGLDENAPRPAARVVVCEHAVEVVAREDRTGGEAVDSLVRPVSRRGVRPATSEPVTVVLGSSSRINQKRRGCASSSSLCSIAAEQALHSLASRKKTRYTRDDG